MLRITSFYAFNFRGIKEVKLDSLPPRVFFTGMTGAGKTSIQHAVQMVLFGRVYDHCGKRITNSDLVGPLGKTAKIQLGLEVNGEPMTAKFQVTKGGSSALSVERPGANAFEGSPDTVRATLWSHISKSPMEYAECGANPKLYLVGNDLGSLLANLCGSDLDHDALDNLLGDHAKWFDKFCDGNGLTCDARSDLSGIGKAAYDCRTDLNRILCEFGYEKTKLDGAELPVDSTGAVIPLKSTGMLDELLLDFKKQRETLVEESNKASVMRPAQAIEADKKRVSNALTKAKAVADKKRQVSADKTDTLEIVQKTITTATNKASNLRGEIRLLEGEASKLKAAVEEFKSGVCPKCSTSLGQTELDRLIGADRIALKERLVKIAGLREEIDACTAKLDSSQEMIEQLEQAHVKARGESAEADGIVMQLNTEMNILDHEQPAKNRSAEEISADLQVLDARMSKATEAKGKLDQIQERHRLELQIQETELELEHLKWAVTMFKDGAAENALGSDGRALFVERANERLTPFGYKINVIVDGKSVTVMMGRQDAVMVPVAQVSDGEFILAQLAVSAAFADDNVVMLDGLDKLDGKNKATVFDALGDIKAGSVWLAGAYGIGGKPDLDPLCAALDPVAVVWVTKGTADITQIPKAA